MGGLPARKSRGRQTLGCSSRAPSRASMLSCVLHWEILLAQMRLLVVADLLLRSLSRRWIFSTSNPSYMFYGMQNLWALHHWSSLLHAPCSPVALQERRSVSMGATAFERVLLRPLSLGLGPCSAQLFPRVRRFHGQVSGIHWTPWFAWLGSVFTWWHLAFCVVLSSAERLCTMRGKAP